MSPSLVSYPPLLAFSWSRQHLRVTLGCAKDRTINVHKVCLELHCRDLQFQCFGFFIWDSYKGSGVYFAFSSNSLLIGSLCMGHTHSWVSSVLSLGCMDDLVCIFIIDNWLYMYVLFKTFPQHLQRHCLLDRSSEDAKTTISWVWIEEKVKATSLAKFVRTLSMRLTIWKEGV